MNMVSLQSGLGDQLRQKLKQDEDGYFLAITDRRCPMWRADGLCRIQAELGEGALCKTCRDFPRLTHDYGDFIEYGLELSCPEAAKYILSQSRPATVTEDIPGGEEPEYDEEAMAVLKATRNTALDILFDPSRPVPEALALTLLYGYQAQGELDGDVWYWPIDINRGEGSSPEGIEGNCVYAFDIELTRKGSADPDTAIKTESARITMEVEKWKEKEEYSVAF